MKISILVPIYKAEKYIEHCAESLFSQDYDNIEFLFVNDCTPDRSIDVLQHFINEKYPDRKPQVRIINHEKNRGSAAARNTLLDNATGDFVCWVDADDWLENGAISTLVNKQNENDYDIVTGWSYEVTNEGTKALRQTDYKTKEEMYDDMWGHEFRHVLWGRIFRRQLYVSNHIRCVDGDNYGEDFLLMILAVYFSNRIACVNDYVYYYNRINESAQTFQYEAKSSVMKWRQYNRNLNSIRCFLEGVGGLNEVVGSNLAKYKREFLYLSAQSRDKFFFNEIKKEIKDDCKKYYGAIGFDNSLYRIIITNYHLYSAFLNLCRRKIR